MALRIKCKCGTSLKISTKLAGKRVDCPNCAKPFRIPIEKFKAAAQAAKRKAAQRTAEAKQAAPPEPMPAELDIQPANLDIEPAEFKYEKSGVLNGFSVDATQAETAALPPTAVPVTSPTPVTSYAGDPRRQASYAQNAAGDAIEDPKRGFWADAFRSFIYPFRGVNNTVVFLIVAAITCLTIPLGWLGCFGLVGIFIIFGWLCSFYLSVISETAAGSEDLPGIKMEGGFLDDIIKPMFKYIGAFAVGLAPAAILSSLLVAGVLPASAAYLAPVWWLMGAFLVPVCLLLFSFDALGMIVRLDLIFLTIIRTILPYLAMWLMLALVLFASFVTSGAEFLTRLGLENLYIDSAVLGIAGLIVFTALDVYLHIVAMRIIGLYYLHFKRRFAIVME